LTISEILTFTKTLLCSSNYLNFIETNSLISLTKIARLYDINQQLALKLVLCDVAYFLHVYCTVLQA